MKITLTPPELRLLANQLGAKYIDFDYLMMMNTAEGEPEVLAGEAKASLYRKGWIDEDFSGNIEVMPEIRQLVMPLFGTREAALLEDRIDDGNAVRIATIRLHAADGAVTMCTQKDKELELCEAQDALLTETAAALVQDVESQDGTCSAEETAAYEPEKVYTVKYCELGKVSEVEMYVQASGKLMYDDNSGTVRTLSGETFVTEAVKIMKGEMIAK